MAAIAEVQVLFGIGKTMQPQTLDKDVINLTKAIRQVESGGKVDARGASGEFGGYQFTPDTWKAYASEAGINVPLEQANREQQNQVAYNKIKQWKDKGYNIGQVASMWNAGQGRPDAYQENHRGTNNYGVQYDTPAYAEKVAQAYQQLKTGVGGTYAPPPQAKPFTPTPTEGLASFRGETSKEDGGYLSDTGGAIKKVGTDLAETSREVRSGDINIASGLLQSAGDVAGGFGGLVDATIKNIPGIGPVYEGATDLLGGAVSGALQSAPGQKAMDVLGVDEWSDEVKGNAEALANILSVVPLTKGVGTGFKLAGDVRTGATLGKVDAGAKEEVVGSLTQKPKRVLERSEASGKDPVGLVLANQEYIPSTKTLNDRQVYDTKAATDKIQQDLKKDEKALQNLLDSTIANQAAGISLNDVLKRTMADLRPTGKLDVNLDAKERYLQKFFENARKSFGRDYVTLSDLNELKRMARKPINYEANDPFNAVSKQVTGDLGRSLMKQVEDYAELAVDKKFRKQIEDLNKEYGTRLDALSIVRFLDERPIKSQGGAEGIIKSFVPERVAKSIGRTVNKTPLQRLKGRRPLLETAKKGLIQTGTGLALSGQLTSEE